MEAGWYDDPYRRFVQRYHDGDDWTEHVSDGSGVSWADPSGTASHIIGSVPLPPPPHESGDRDRSDAGTGSTLGSPWARLGARLIDALVIGVPLYVLVSVVYEVPLEFSDDFTTYTMHAGSYALLGVLLAAYEIVMVGAIGRTVGKMAVGLTVVSASAGGVPGFGRSALRWIAFLLYNVPYGIGLVAAVATIVMSFVDPRRQTIHDKIAGTVVVRSAGR